jgi:hypothetical protein
MDIQGRTVRSSRLVPRVFDPTSRRIYCVACSAWCAEVMSSIRVASIEIYSPDMSPSTFRSCASISVNFPSPIPQAAPSEPSLWADSSTSRAITPSTRCVQPYPSNPHLTIPQIPAAWVVAMAPHTITLKLAKSVDNTAPRTYAQSIEKDQTLDNAVCILSSQ